MSRKSKALGGVGERSLGLELRRLREKAGLSLEKVGALVGWSANTLSRLERGLRADTTAEDISAILVAIGVTGAERDRLMRRARGEEQGLWEGNNANLSDQARTYLEFERRATRIVDVEPMVVPGLLQTPAYTHALLLALGIDKSQIPGMIARRIRRQELLARRWDPPEVVFVVCELTMRQPLGGRGVMAEQLLHMAELAELPHVSIRVVPTSVVVHPGVRGPFVVLEFEDEAPVVHIEGRQSGMFPENRDEIEAYRLDAERSMDLALAERESVDLLRVIAEDLTRAR